MKKIKAFFSRLKARFVSVWGSTQLPFRIGVILAILGLSAVFVNSSLSFNKKSYKALAETSSANVYVNTATVLTFSASNANYQQSFTAVPLALMLKPSSGSYASVYSISYDSNDVLGYRLARNLPLPLFFVDTSYLTKSTTVVASSRGNVSVTADYCSVFSSQLSNLASFSIDFTNRTSNSNEFAIDIYFKLSNGNSGGNVRLRFTGFSFSPSVYSLKIGTSSVTSSDNPNYLVGFEQGYNKGLSSTLGDITPTKTLFQMVNEFFSTPLFGDVSFGLLVSLGLGVILLGFLIKVFLGG